MKEITINTYIKMQKIQCKLEKLNRFRVFKKIKIKLEFEHQKNILYNKKWDFNFKMHEKCIGVVQGYELDQKRKTSNFRPFILNIERMDVRRWYDIFRWRITWCFKVTIRRAIFVTVYTGRCFASPFSPPTKIRRV